jgi:hypothetical protein
VNVVDGDVVLAEESRDRTGRAVSDAQPENPGRGAHDQAALLEIGVLRDDGPAVLGGELPDVGI